VRSGRALIVALIVGSALLVGAVATAVLVPRDVSLPGDLAPYVDAARERARAAAGLPEPIPLRVTGARCSTDLASAVLAFETPFGHRSYAIIGFGETPGPDDPGSPTAIVGQSEAEFEASSGAGTVWTEACPP
jgi:hypothetical protein